jgi:hypothetical protein
LEVRERTVGLPRALAWFGLGVVLLSWYGREPDRLLLISIFVRQQST